MENEIISTHKDQIVRMRAEIAAMLNATNSSAFKDLGEVYFLLCRLETNLIEKNTEFFEWVDMAHTRD